jgi:predicted transcriptional regulator
MKIGDTIYWIWENYWSTKHPDECGYEYTIARGTVINFDESKVVVLTSERSGIKTIIDIMDRNKVSNSMPVIGPNNNAVGGIFSHLIHR